MDCILKTQDEYNEIFILFFSDDKIFSFSYEQIREYIPLLLSNYSYIEYDEYKFLKKYICKITFSSMGFEFIHAYITQNLMQLLYPKNVEGSIHFFINKLKIVPHKEFNSFYSSSFEEKNYV
jgi:hypothetical protein